MSGDHYKKDHDSVSNPSHNPTFQEVAQERISRRKILQGGLSAMAYGLLGTPMGGCDPEPQGEVRSPLETQLRFSGVPVSADDSVHVPTGYTAQVLFAWGDPLSNGPSFRQDGLNTAAEQAEQAGMQHDGQHFYSLPYNSKNSNHGLLAMNHEITDEGLLHGEGAFPVTAAKVAKSQAAVGVSIIEVHKHGHKWSVVRPSSYARRITATTPCNVSGPAAGHSLLVTAADPSGRRILGTMQNCAYGATPWGTYLTCEENFNLHFINSSGAVPAEQSRYGVPTGPIQWNRWAQFDPRFDAALHPNEFNRFGWVVEIDPYDPHSTPIKRTALGRFKREGAAILVGRDRRIGIYSGDDERFEYIYKFVTRDPYHPNNRAANRDLLDHGTLYVARFHADGSGEWLELTHGKNGLTAAAGFVDQGAVVVNARRAADVAGATKMDRPEWTAVHPKTHELYATLTNNNRRGQTGLPPADPANPRNDNVYGHIIRWREQGNDPTATRFQWDIFILCGDPANVDPNKHGNINGDIFGAPDSLYFDRAGRLWIGTDISMSVALTPPNFQNLGNNALLVADPQSGEVRRFLVGPFGCEITGACGTPDGRTLFVQIQHPGEPPSEETAFGQELAISTWPDGPGRAGRPRAATLVIQRKDGGIVGT